MTTCIRVALAGNPNSGKTTLFNALTGARQHVGNYPGVTVERRTGVARRKGVEFEIVDLPGTYSLTTYSLEERIARDAILDPKLDVVVDVVDATNLDRNLYLTTQLLELGKPVVIALNMSDVAHAQGIAPDARELSALLGCPVVETVGHRGEGVEALLDEIAEIVRHPQRYHPPHVRYGAEIEKALEAIEGRIGSLPADSRPLGPPRWLALKLLEGDETIAEQARDPSLREEASRRAAALATHGREGVEAQIAEARYGFVSGVCQRVLRNSPQLRHTISDRIDLVVTHGLLGIPIFLFMMFLVFRFTFALGEPMMAALETVMERLSEWVSALWPDDSQSLFRSLLVDGVIGGVGGVITFVPNIMLLFFALSLLEDSGYMARAAFIVDHLMRRIGLHGRSFIPMVIGFGCNIPGIMATRTLEAGRARLATILVLPLMSCGARLTIYMLLIPAFFPPHQRAYVLWLMYVVGILAAIGLARLLRSTLLRGETAPLVLELPPYRWPTLRGALLRMWNQSLLYLRKAGTIILAISVLLWALTTFPRLTTFSEDYEAREAAVRAHYEGVAQRIVSEHRESSSDSDGVFAGMVERIQRLRTQFAEIVSEEHLQETDRAYRDALQELEAALSALRSSNPDVFHAALRYVEEVAEPLERELAEIANARRTEQLLHSWAGRIGRRMEPALRPLGFDWRIGTALIGAFAAKEVFVAQMGIVFSIGEENVGALRERLRATYTPLTAISLLLFCLISAPCMATVAVTRQEAGGWRWAALQFFGLTAFAYVLSFLVYQIGRLWWG